MSTLDLLQELEGISVTKYNCELFAKLRDDITKLLAVVEAAKIARKEIDDDFYLADVLDKALAELDEETKVG